MPQKLILDRTSTFIDIYSMFGFPCSEFFLVPWLFLRITVCLKVNCKLWNQELPLPNKNIFVGEKTRIESSDGYTG